MTPSLSLVPLGLAALLAFPASALALTQEPSAEGAAAADTELAQPAPSDVEGPAPKTGAESRELKRKDVKWIRR